jgi:ligand-binding SRPBCC domain-containing protein
MAFYQFKRSQQLNTSIEELWDFISSPANLKQITPSEMGFDITSGNDSEKMYAGMIISYRLKPLPFFTTNWVTEITHVEDNCFFIDEQRIGPYKLWHHQHILVPKESGVLMQDIITYQPPFGIIGTIANKLVIEKKLNEIFEYRRQVLDLKFNKYRLSNSA